MYQAFQFFLPCDIFVCTETVGFLSLCPSVWHHPDIVAQNSPAVKMKFRKNILCLSSFYFVPCFMLPLSFGTKRNSEKDISDKKQLFFFWCSFLWANFIHLPNYSCKSFSLVQSTKKWHTLQKLFCQAHVSKLSVCVSHLLLAHLSEDRYQQTKICIKVYMCLHVGLAIILTMVCNSSKTRDLETCLRVVGWSDGNTCFLGVACTITASWRICSKASPDFCWRLERRCLSFCNT